MRWPLPWPKSWREESPPEDAKTDKDTETPKTLRESALLFARDLAVAFLIVGIVMGLLFAYTNVWPPMVVVESDSMQHARTTSSIGVIDTGDLVLVQAVHAPTDITTYVEASRTGYETYENFGEVIIFHAPGRSLDDTPIIHRAMVYVVFNASGGVDAPSLVGRPASEWSGLVGAVPAAQPFHLSELTLKGVRSWHTNAPTTVDISWATGAFRSSGFLTKGDHNPGPSGDGWGDAVGVDRIIGRGRGELPWFGLIKLTLSPGTTGCCHGWGDDAAPKNSWDSLLAALAIIIVGPFAADFGWAFWTESRKKRRARAKEAASPESSPADPMDEPPPPDPEGDVTTETQTTSAEPEDDGLEDL